MAREEKKVDSVEKSYFDVLGICCPSEVPIIEKILNSLDGVKSFSVVVPTRTVIVVHDTLLLSQLQIVKALNQARLEANVRVKGEKNFKNKWPSPYAISSGILLLLSLLKYVYHPLQWFAIGAVAIGIYPILAKAFTSIINFRLDINVLALVAVIGTIALRDYTEAATIVFLFTIAEWLQSRASHKANSAMSSLMSLAPQKAIIAETGEEVEATSVKLNTVLAIKAGEIIPIDGVVVDGKCEVDEKTLTGESFPVLKLENSTVWAGTINIDGYVRIKTTALAEDCVVAQMGKLVEEAQNSKSKTQRFIDKYSQYYTPAVFIVAACFAAIPAALQVKNLTHWLHLALVVLVSACPCGLILSTPVATFCALTKAAKSGVLIKGGDFLETLAKIKVVGFDKTGTITRGEFVVTDFKSLSQDISISTLLYWVSSIECKSSHPMAGALVDYVRSFSIEPKPENVEDYQNFPGEGIYGKIDRNDIFIGNRKISLRAGSSTVIDMEQETNGGKTKGYIYCGCRAIGVFSLTDVCRSGVAQAVKELNSLGIKAVMLTGDNQEAAVYVQQQLGNILDSVHSELLPEDKARIIRELKTINGPTAMVGDGINDAPALATADVGISMGVSGSALATETGNVLLMSNDIRKIPKIIKLARKTRRKVLENVLLSVTTKGAILALAFAGHPLVWAAVLADVGTCVLVILNSMLLLQERKEISQKCYRQIDQNIENVVLEIDVKKSCCDDGGCKKTCQENRQNVIIREEGNCKSTCCDRKTESSCVGIINDGTKLELQVKNIQNCKSGCCGNKTDASQLKSDENHNLSGVGYKNDGLKSGPEVTNIKSCESSCCGLKTDDLQVKIDEIGESSCVGLKTDDVKLELEMKDTKNCKSSCCDEDRKLGLVVKHVEICKSSCCGPKIADTKNCCDKGGCKNQEPRESAITCAQSAADVKITLAQPATSCKSSCCGPTLNIPQEENMASYKINFSENVRDNFENFQVGADTKTNEQVKINESCRSSCCGSKPQVIRKQASCCVDEKCGDDRSSEQFQRKDCCKSLELKKNGDGCCRSYARECCRSKPGIGGSLTEIVIE